MREVPVVTTPSLPRLAARMGAALALSAAIATPAVAGEPATLRLEGSAPAYDSVVGVPLLGGGSSLLVPSSSTRPPGRRRAAARRSPRSPPPPRPRRRRPTPRSWGCGSTPPARRGRAGFWSGGSRSPTAARGRPGTCGSLSAWAPAWRRSAPRGPGERPGPRGGAPSAGCWRPFPPARRRSSAAGPGLAAGERREEHDHHPAGRRGRARALRRHVRGAPGGGCGRMTLLGRCVVTRRSVGPPRGRPGPMARAERRAFCNCRPQGTTATTSPSRPRGRETR
jgi:hypothetical protein